MTLKKNLWLVAVTMLATPAVAQLPNIEIQEVLADPVGPNAAAQLIELANRSGNPVDLTGIYLVSGANQIALPMHLMPVDGIVVLHLGASGTTNPTDVYLPQAAPLAPSDTISIFASAAFTDPTELIDFVSFGGGMTGIQLAVTAGQWPSIVDSVVAPTVQGETIAHYGDYVLGSRHAASAWFVDGTPTIGTNNDPAAFFGVAPGCLGTFAPTFHLNGLDNRPWIGHTWQLELFLLSPNPSTVWLALGTQGPWSSLGAIGMTNCYTALVPFAITPYQMPANAGLIQVPVPNLAALVGAELRMQALASGFPTANSAGALASQPMLVVIGSR